jgi:ABC-2 type transport system permease protein
MNKTSIIIRREYLTRIRKRSFIVMTLLGPVLFAAMLVLPMWFASMEAEDVKQIAVIDSSQLFIRKIPETAKFKFTYAADVKLEDFKKNLAQTEYFGILYIPPYIAYNPRGVEFYSYRQAPANLTMHIANAIEKEIETDKLKAHHIENLDDILKSVKTNIDIRTFKLSESGTEKESHSFLNMGVAYASALLIYMFIFLFGSQVMRGVIEEKTSRIVEVIVSSVKPFQLLMGKVAGVALVGLTQFLAWIALTLILVILAQSIFLPGLTGEALQQAGSVQVIGSLAGDTVQHSATTETAREMLNMIQSINFGVLIGSFLFFFVGGYLLYGSLFAAIGSAVDTDADTQQFMLPITIPLIIAIMVMVNAMQNPDGPLAFWFSIIPLTSPVVMMARIPFGVPYGELALSMALLILAFMGAVWLSAKIYRTGILIYGKKMTYRELWKWLTYKN